MSQIRFGDALILVVVAPFLFKAGIKQESAWFRYGLLAYAGTIAYEALQRMK